MGAEKEQTKVLDGKTRRGKQSACAMCRCPLPASAPHLGFSFQHRNSGSWGTKLCTRCAGLVYLEVAKALNANSANERIFGLERKLIVAPSLVGPDGRGLVRHQ